MDEPDPEEHGWAVEYRGPGWWAAVDRDGNEGVTGPHDGVMRFVARNPAPSNA